MKSEGTETNFNKKKILILVYYIYYINQNTGGQFYDNKRDFNHYLAKRNFRVQVYADFDCCLAIM